MQQRAPERRAAPRPERTLADMLDGDCLGAMRHAATRQDQDRVLITRAYGITGDDTRTPADFRAAMRRAYRAGLPLELHAEAAGYPVGALATRIMRDAGFDPADLVIASLWSNTNVLAVVDEGLRISLYASRHDERSLCTIRLGREEDALWENGENREYGAIELFRPIPETLRVAAAGRPLREVLGHSAIDHLDLVVTETSLFEKNGSTILVLGPAEGWRP